MKRLVAVALLGSSAVLVAQSGRQASIDWPYWGADPAQSKYSAAAQITRANVGNLELAWRWENGEKAIPEFEMRPGGLSSTPIMIDDVLYISTGYHRVIALDAETGKQIWAFDPQDLRRGTARRGHGPPSRRDVLARRRRRRILIAARNQLFAVNAKTGQPVQGVRRRRKRQLERITRARSRAGSIQQTSPGVVYRESGHCRAAGFRTGSSTAATRRDRFRPSTSGPANARGSSTRFRSRRRSSAPTPGRTSRGRHVGHANVWAAMALDEQRGLLYAATSTMSGDYWGGQRAGANLFAETLLCLDAKTGKRVWHFQAVHHGLWDWDFASPPNLVTITVDGKRIDAVAQLSKQGFTYVFDRVTGEPVWPIEERPVDTEVGNPRREAVSDAAVSHEAAGDGTAGHLAGRCQRSDAGDQEARAGTDEAVHARTDVHPANFQGSIAAAVEQRRLKLGRRRGGSGNRDPVPARIRHVLHQRDLQERLHRSVRGRRVRQLLRLDWPVLVARQPPAGWRSCPRRARAATRERGVGRARTELGRGGGSARATGVVNPLGPIPLTKPPYAHLLAVDLNRGEIAWKVGVRRRQSRDAQTSALERR